jgi:hypothetical protein
MSLSMNNNNDPCTFSGTVRQSNRAFHHIIYRTPNNLHPGHFSSPFLNGNKAAQIVGSVDHDILDTSSLIEEYITALGNN